MSLLEVRDVAVCYPDGTRALQSVSFQAEAGEIVGIVGRSGAGKSTLLRCINGLQAVSGGQVVLAGRDVARLRGRARRMLRREVGFIWQDANLVGRLTALTNVLMGRLGYKPFWQTSVGYFSRAERELAVHQLERVHMLQRARHRADRLSGGERQRCAIARALTQEPRVLLADEPVASLDPQLARQVVRLLATLAREDGLLTLVNLHQVDLATDNCDRILGLADGRIVFDGSPAALDDVALGRIYGTLMLPEAAAA